MTDQRDDREAPDGEDVPEDQSDVDEEFTRLIPNSEDDDRDEDLPSPP